MGLQCPVGRVDDVAMGTRRSKRSCPDQRHDDGFELGDGFAVGDDVHQASATHAEGHHRPRETSSAAAAQDGAKAHAHVADKVGIEVGDANPLKSGRR